MKGKDKKYYKFVNLVCDGGSLMSLIISFIYTVKFFTAGTKEFEMLIMLMLSVIFETVKILLVIAENKKIFTKMLMLLFILISILFTMNSFLNKIEIEKLQTKSTNPEYEKTLDKINNKKIEIENKKLEIKENKDLKDKAVNGINENLASKRIETAKLYQEQITSKELEFEKLQKELNVLLDNDVEKFVYSDTNNTAINTKILDFMFKDKLNQKTKNLIICIFFALLIDFTHLTLSFVKKESVVKLNEIIEIEKKEAKKEFEIKEIEKKEAKKKEIINSIETVKTNNGFTKTNNVISLKKETNSNRKELSPLADKILSLTISNDGNVPNYRDLMQSLDISMSVVQRRVKELKDLNLIYRIEGTKQLKMIETESTSDMSN